MIKNNSGILLSKFGEQRWIDSLINGNMSFSCAGNYILQAKKTGNDIQGDLYEAIFARLYKNDSRIIEQRQRLKKDLEEIEDGNFILLRRKSAKLKPIFCFYGYKAEDVLNDCKDPVSGNNTVLHEYNEKLYSGFSKSMGNNVVADEYRLTQLTLKPEPFVNRVKAAMARHGYGYIMNPVDYKIRAEETFFIQPTDKYEELFYKDPKYSYQLETRIFITGKQFWNVFERYNLFIGKFQEDTYWKSYNPMKFLLEVILEEADEEQIE